MSETNIYKRQELPAGKGKKRRKRRVPRRTRFDDHSNRKRRSKNSGFRRLLHLYRKENAQKYVWRGALIFFVVSIVLAAIYQFWYLDKVVQKEMQEKHGALPAEHSTK